MECPPLHVLSLVTTHAHTHPCTNSANITWAIWRMKRRGGRATMWMGGPAHTYARAQVHTHRKCHRLPTAMSIIYPVLSSLYALQFFHCLQLSCLGLVEGKIHDAYSAKQKPKLMCNGRFFIKHPSLFMCTTVTLHAISTRLTGQWSEAPFKDSPRTRGLSLQEMLKKCVLHSGWAQCAASLLQACTLHPNHWLKHEDLLHGEPGVIQNNTIACTPKHSKGIAA